jgi:UDP-N-acetylglucosamine 2-epimerase (hydrolysing)
MENILSKTIMGFSAYIKDIEPNLIIIHWDRVEALAWAIVWSLDNVLTAHIEWWEKSWTIDELIRHAVSKMSHIHFTSNNDARMILRQMWESDKSIYNIWSPDIDYIQKKKNITIDSVKKYYDIEYNSYAILLYHPITTEFDNIDLQAKNLVDAICTSTNNNFIVIYPNNDKWSEFIFSQYKRLENKKNIKIFPSIRFEYFLVLLENAKFIVGNSSAWIREAPYYWVPTINIWTRQSNRSLSKNIINCACDTESILKWINDAGNLMIEKENNFGNWNSDILFLNILKEDSFWNIKIQKKFQDINH